MGLVRQYTGVALFSRLRIILHSKSTVSLQEFKKAYIGLEELRYTINLVHDNIIKYLLSWNGQLI